MKTLLRGKFEVIATVTVRKPLRKRIETEEGFTSEPDGFLVGDVRIAVDIESLGTRLGLRAITSKGKRSIMAHGAIVGEVFNVRKEWL